jgi:hypothetical protein
MRCLLLIGLVIALAALSTGCNRESPAPDLQGKLDTALAIDDVKQRDLAVAKAIDEAASAITIHFSKRTEFVKKALSKISDPRFRDQTAEAAAKRLLGSGAGGGAAEEVAKTISDASQRDRVLSELAKLNAPGD